MGSIIRISLSLVWITFIFKYFRINTIIIFFYENVKYGLNRWILQKNLIDLYFDNAYIFKNVIYKIILITHFSIGKCGEDPPLPRNCDGGRKLSMPLFQLDGMGRRAFRMIPKSGDRLKWATRWYFRGKVGLKVKIMNKKPRFSFVKVGAFFVLIETNLYTCYNQTVKIRLNHRLWKIRYCIFSI